jgi:hypothetical protein
MVEVESETQVVATALIHLESPPESIVVIVPPSAEGILIITKGGDGTLIIHEALPLSESLTD